MISLVQASPGNANSPGKSTNMTIPRLSGSNPSRGFKADLPIVRKFEVGIFMFHILIIFDCQELEESEIHPTGKLRTSKESAVFYQYPACHRY